MTARMPSDHSALAERLCHRILDGPGKSDPALRQAVASAAAGGAAVPAPYHALAREIGEAAHDITDTQVAAVVNAAGSERATFELILAAAVGAGLCRWQHAVTVLGDASDATS